MDEEVGIKNERVDDIPLLLAQMERMGIQPLLDSCFSSRTENGRPTADLPQVKVILSALDPLAR